MAMPGGLKPAQEADQNVKDLVAQQKTQIELKTGATYETFEAEQYSTQVVAGVNYFVKINVGNEYIHARIYKDLSGNVSVHSVQTGKSKDDALEYFQ